MNMTYKFSWIDFCGEAPVRSLKPFLLILNRMMVSHNSCVFNFSISGLKSLSSSISNSYLTCFVDWRFLCSWFRFPKAVAILLGGRFNNCLLLRPGQVSKFQLLTAFRIFLSVGLKKHPCRYCIRSVFGFSFVIIAWDLCLNSIEMGMSHNPYDLFMYPFKTSLGFLIMFISLLSNMVIQSSFHIFLKDIIKALCIPSKMCALFACKLRFPDKVMFPIFFHSWWQC